MSGLIFVGTMLEGVCYEIVSRGQSRHQINIHYYEFDFYECQSDSDERGAHNL